MIQTALLKLTLTQADQLLGIARGQAITEIKLNRYTNMVEVYLEGRRLPEHKEGDSITAYDLRTYQEDFGKPNTKRYSVEIVEADRPE